ncbi:nucleotide exchange factor GrpE [Jongsikchunia kroppenstedtii]|uniref:nucleotide exchange factor GrpE n=1 Tax=Jongsikchunia kroppenstedtii TaxID=1121721 RepID=UPI00037479EA|nr:nucleotide exchange factor GrpE [Jongsikchunia kroppenstedtii]
MTSPHEDEQEPVTVSDRRRIDPESGDVREDAAGEAGVQTPAGPAADGASVPADQVDQLAELTSDLQRLQADFANYRRRAEKERLGSVEFGKASVAEQLLPILDDLDRARQHGDLEEGPLRAIADKLIDTLSGVGLREFGAPGEPFDPALHEAVQHDGDGANPVIGTVYRKGYRVGERVLRHAMVVVIDAAGSGTEASVPPAESQPESNNN